MLKNLLLCVWVSLLCSCAMVSLKTQDTRDYIMSKRADVLSDKHLSASAMEVVGVVAKNRRECEHQINTCIDAIAEVGLQQQSPAYLAAMSELWLYQAQQLQKQANQVDAYHNALRICFLPAHPSINGCWTAAKCRWPIITIMRCRLM